MKVQVKARGLAISARKLRLVADMVRDMDVVPAQQLMLATNKKAADMVLSALKSASANAENNYNLSRNNLRIDEIRVDEGSTLKRSRPRAKGSSSAIFHRSSHLVVTVADDKRPVKESKKTANAAKPAVSTKTTKPTAKDGAKKETT